MVQLVNDNRPMIIAIDFDGTLVDSYSDGDLYLDVPLYTTKLLPTLINLKEKYGDCLFYILFTCRHDENLQEVVDVCKYCGLEFDAVNNNYPDLPFETSGKVYADLYIDNRANGKAVDPDYLQSYISGIVESDLIRPFEDR